MFNFLKKSENSSPSWLSRLSEGLKRTRHAFADSLANLVLGKKQIDAALLTELENQLLLADLGVEVSEQILQQLTQQVARKELNDPQRLIVALQDLLESLLSPYHQPLILRDKPFVILMVGVNGAGKTTTIAKLCHFYQQQGNRVILAAGDTFRAAAIEQLQQWGQRNQVPVISQHSGADSASVIYDASTNRNSKTI